MARCNEITKSGRRCRLHCMRSSNKCMLHNVQEETPQSTEHETPETKEEETPQTKEEETPTKNEKLTTKKGSRYCYCVISSHSGVTTTYYCNECKEDDNRLVYEDLNKVLIELESLRESITSLWRKVNHIIFMSENTTK